MKSLGGFFGWWKNPHPSFNLLVSFREDYWASISSSYAIGYNTVDYPSSHTKSILVADSMRGSNEMTGIAVRTEISAIVCIENHRYPAEPRYSGVFETYAGVIFPFITDVQIPQEKESYEAVGRIDNKNGETIVELTELTPLQK